MPPPDPRSGKGRQCRGRAHAVLVAGAAGDANRPDDLATDDNRHAALDRDRAFEGQDAEAGAARSQTILKHFRRALESRGRSGLRKRDVHAAGMGVVPFLEIDQPAGDVHDGHGHGPLVFPGFGNRRRGELLGRLYGDRGSVHRWRIIAAPAVLDFTRYMNAHAILVKVSDRLGLLSALSKTLADHQGNITYVDIHSEDAASYIYFEFTKPEGGIDDLLAELAAIAGVEQVRETPSFAKIYGKRIVVIGGGAQVGLVATGAISEADRHNIRRTGTGRRRACGRAIAARVDAGPGGVADGRRYHRRRPRSAGGRPAGHFPEHGGKRAR